MKQAFCCLLSLLLAGYNASAQTDWLLKNDKPKYDFLLIKPAPVKQDQNLSLFKFTIYTETIKQSNKAFTFKMPKGYFISREPDYDAPGIFGSLLSEIYIKNMHDRYPKNPAYHYYNNVRNK